MDTFVGTSIGGYTLIKLLGSGGMGTVYQANDPQIGQQVAVKVIRTDLDSYTDSASAQSALERFRQEARAVARLDHLHILPLYRYGEEETPDGLRAYMIMQYRPEGSLWDWLRRRADLSAGLSVSRPAGFPASLPTNWPLNVAEVADYVQQAASALQYAHEHGIVHRDIKPANFLLRVDAQEKTVHLLLSDFGLAKVFTASSATNTILGTPTYMAPEQFEGGARPESDQYALAVTAYYLLAGRPPFEGDALQLMRQHMNVDVPSLTSFNSNIPSALNGILVRALAKAPEQRFPSIAAFAEAFARASRPQSSQSLLAERSPGPLVLPSIPNRTPGAYNAPPAFPAPGIYNSPSPTPTVYSAPNANPATGMYGTQGLSSNPPQTYQPANAPAGFAPPRPPGYPNQQQRGEQSGGQPTSRRSVLGWIIGGAAAVAVGGGVAAYFYIQNNQNSPASQQGQTQTPLPASTGQASAVLNILTGHSAAVTSLSWLPNANQLASGSLDQTVRLWSSSGGTAQQTLEAGSDVRAVAWSPDGAQLAIGMDDHSLGFWKTSDPTVKHLSSPTWDASIRALAWNSDSSLLYLGVYGNGLHAINANTYAHLNNSDPGVRVLSLALSPGGSLLTIGLESGSISLNDLNNKLKTAGLFPARYGAVYALAWSPDGSSLAVGYANNIAIIYDVNTRQIKQKLNHNASVYSVAWNPSSGAGMLATGAGDNTVNIWNPGTSGPVVYSRHKDAVLSVAWNSNGILASASRDQTVILWQPQSS